MTADRPDGRWVYLDAGIYSGLVETIGEAIRYPVLTERAGEPVPTTLAGPTCDSADILNPSTPYLLPRTLQTGDRLILSATGAYVTTYSSVWFNGFEPLRQECLRR